MPIPPPPLPTSPSVSQPPAFPFRLPFFLILLVLLTCPLSATADLEPVQLVGVYSNLPVPPFAASCPSGLRIAQVEPLVTSDGSYFVIPHDRIALTVADNIEQACTSEPVNAPRFGNLSATILLPETDTTLDQSNPLIAAFSASQEKFFLGRELGPRMCGPAILPAASVSMWMSPETVINVVAGDYSINFKPGSKYIYYFSEDEPCLFRGGAKATGTVQPVPTPLPPSPSPGSSLSAGSGGILPPASSTSSPVPTSDSSVIPIPDDGVTVTDGSIISDPQPACFPSDAVVTTRHGNVLIAQLGIGEHVRVGHQKYSQVFAFTHSSRHVVSSFIILCTKHRALALSPGHYIYANGRVVRADKVRIGDYLQDVDHGMDRVIRIESRAKRGLFNPQTVEGNIVVNGILTTTFTSALRGMMTGHALLTPFRALRPWVMCSGLDDFTQRIRHCCERYLSAG